MLRLAENPVRSSKASRVRYASSTSSSEESSSVWSSESEAEAERAKAKKQRRKGKQKVGKEVDKGKGSGRKEDRHIAGGSGPGVGSVVAGNEDEDAKKAAKEAE